MDLAATTLELCALPSETGQEGAIADHVVRVATDLAGAAAVVRQGHCVVVTPSVPGDAPRVGFFGHLDTVRVAADQPLELRDGKVYGCGASDMKSGLACMLKLLAEREQLHALRPVFVFYDREEGPVAESTLPGLLDSGSIPPLELAVVLEPTDNVIQAGCMGGLHARVVVAGQRAHSARPWQGDNALYRAIPLLQRLRAFGRRAVTVGELTFYEVLTATTATTANSRNVVPDRLELNLNYRFAPGREPAEAIRELQAFVGELGEVTIEDVAPAGAVALEHPLVSRWRARHALRVEPKQAWTDVAQLTMRGIPAFNFGPGATALAHQARECVAVAALEAGYRLIKELGA